MILTPEDAVTKLCPVRGAGENTCAGTVCMWWEWAGWRSSIPGSGLRIGMDVNAEPYKRHPDEQFTRVGHCGVSRTKGMIE